MPPRTPDHRDPDQRRPAPALQTLKLAGAGVGGFLLGPFCVFVGMTLSAMPGPSWLQTPIEWLGASGIFVLPFGLVAGIGIPIMLVGSVWEPRLKKDRGLWAALWVGIALSWLITWQGDLEGVRMGYMRDIARRGDPIVDAVHAHIRDHGKPPKTMEALVPRYLPAIPDTGALGYRPFEYRLDEDGTYRITVDTPRGILNWDELLYTNDEEFLGRPEDLTRLGRWRYFHE